MKKRLLILIHFIFAFGFMALTIPRAIAQLLDTDKQIGLRLQALPAGEKILHWTGQANHTFFIQASPDLSGWTWAPNIEPGLNGPMSYEVDGPTAKGFFRVIRTPQTAANLDTADFDGDGLSNLYEITPRSRSGGTNGFSQLGPYIQANSLQTTPFQTNPLLADTDGDLLNDKWEEDHGFDPNDPGTGDPDNGPNGDPDGDGANNLAEQTAGTDPKSAADFPVLVVSISKNSYGYSRSNPPDYLPNGVFRWRSNWFDDYHEDFSSNLEATPSNLLSKITDIEFPALPPSQFLQGHGDGQGPLGNSHGAANSIFFSKTKSTPIYYPNSPISTGLRGDIKIQRIWLKAPISTRERKFEFLRQKTKSTFDDDLWVGTNEIISTEAVSMVIPAGQTYSAPLDFQPIPAIVEGYSMTSTASDTLLLVEVKAVFERDQVANRIPNPKRPNYYAITSSGNSEDSKSKYYNRLFVSTEPETGDVELTVKHSVFPHSIAQFLTVDITDDTGQVIANAQLDESGETKIEFLPLESTPTKVFYVDISYQSAAGQDPELLLKSYTKNDGLSIQIVTPENIQIQKNSLALVIAPFANTTAGSFYTTFLGTTSSPTESVSLAPEVRAIHEEPPTMIAGSTYDQSSWTTEIPSFQLPDGSGASNIAETYFSREAGFGLHEICRNLMEQNHGQIWSDLTTAGVFAKNYTFSIPVDTGVSFYYPDLVPPKYIWGGATYKSGSVTLKLKKIGNKIEATGIDMQAVIEDYYDFDYTRAIGTFSNRAATIQIGREIPPRSAGKIFHTLTDINFSYNESTGDLINGGVTNGGPPIPFFNANGYIQDGNFITTGGAGGGGNE